MYKEGDRHPLGVVEWNHCGFPWPVSMRGEFFGVVQVRSSKGVSTTCDARSGKPLTPEELEGRLNRTQFDYEGKAMNRREWSKKNQPYGPFYYLYRDRPFAALMIFEGDLLACFSNDGLNIVFQTFTVKCPEFYREIWSQPDSVVEVVGNVYES